MSRRESMILLMVANNLETGFISGASSILDLNSSALFYILIILHLPPPEQMPGPSRLQKTSSSINSASHLTVVMRTLLVERGLNDKVSQNEHHRRAASSHFTCNHIIIRSPGISFRFAYHRTVELKLQYVSLHTF